MLEFDPALSTTAKFHPPMSMSAESGLSNVKYLGVITTAQFWPRGVKCCEFLSSGFPFAEF